eukprot:UN30248
MVLANGRVSVIEEGRFLAQVEFTPMLPEDEQLVNYGLDTTLSVATSKPKDKQKSEITSIDFEHDTNGKYSRGVVNNTKTTTTLYKISNNSSRRVPKFYIDHSASAMHGGFVIKTKEKSIKEVTGFCRYDFKLNPNETVEFEVVEVAEYQTYVPTSSRSLETFIKKHKKDGLLDEKQVSTLETQVVLESIRAVLRTLESPRYITESTANQWKEDKIFAVSKGEFDKKQVDKLLQ